MFEERLELEVLPAFKGRILAFDLDISNTYSILVANARSAGRAISKEDGYIAATAATHGFAIATRDTGPFIVAGLKVINPWVAV